LSRHPALALGKAIEGPVLVLDGDRARQGKATGGVHRILEGLGWTTALRAPAIRQLVEAGALQLSFFDERALAEIQSPDYPDERLIVCKNPLMATRRTQKRQALLEATERELDKIVAARSRTLRPLKWEADIGLRVGKVLNRFKMAKHFICMLAYYVEWHMRQALAPLLFDDDDKATADAQRDSIVAPAKASPGARDKARTLRTPDDPPVHGFQTLIADLATIAENRIRPKLPGAEAFDQITRPTPLQRRAFDLLGVKR
jgi:hypothetical protein